jgi:rod shape-determining protein MreD
MRLAGSHIWRFIWLIGLQVLIFNQFQFLGYLNPMPYVLIILLLPPSTSRFLLLLAGFITGLAVDIFSGEIGLHAAASVLLAYVRPGLQKLFMTQGLNEYESLDLENMGAPRFVTYAGFAILIHHLYFFLMEAFKLSELPTIFWRTFLSSIFTLFVVFILQLLSRKKPA